MDNVYVLKFNNEYYYLTDCNKVKELGEVLFSYGHELVKYPLNNISKEDFVLVYYCSINKVDLSKNYYQKYVLKKELDLKGEFTLDGIIFKSTDKNYLNAIVDDFERNRM